MHALRTCIYFLLPIIKYNQTIKGYQKLIKYLIPKKIMKINKQREVGKNILSREKKTSKSNITNILIQSKGDITSMKHKYLLLKWFIPGEEK